MMNAVSFKALSTPDVTNRRGVCGFSFRTDEYRPRSDAGRFSMGTPAVPTVYTALGGMEIILEVVPPTLGAAARHRMGQRSHLSRVLRGGQASVHSQHPPAPDDRCR